MKEKTIEKVITISEAAFLWDMPRATVRNYCTGYKMHEENKFSSTEARQTANASGTWLILKKAMEKRFGKPKRNMQGEWIDEEIRAFNSADGTSKEGGK